MMKLSHKFVIEIPEKLEDGVIYISLEYATAIHKCCCGCGKEVVTPLSPNDWSLIFDGKTISLYPSIGNWSFKCQSHYFIVNNTVEWAPKWNKRRIEYSRKKEELNRKEYYREQYTKPAHAFLQKLRNIFK